MVREYHSIMEKDISQKVLDLLLSEGIETIKVRETLVEITSQIDNKLWEKLSLSPSLLFSLKDIVWYNIEHLSQNGEDKGLSSLKYLGSKYPIFMYETGNNDIFVMNEQLEPLLKELEDILARWSNDWVFVELYTPTMQWVGGGENPSPVIIYDPQKESPSKYGYKPHQQYTTILNSKGDQLQSTIPETVLCKTQMKLGTFGREPLMRQLLERLIEKGKKAVENKKGIMFELSEYDYNS